MRYFLKVFFISLLCFVLTVGAGIYTYIKFFNPSTVEDFTQVKDPTWDAVTDSEEIETTPLEKAISNSKRINIVLLGLEHSRTDTIMLISFDKSTASADIISIPRDTFYHRAGFDAGGNKKINAIYSSTGAHGVMNALENIMKIPVDNYITVDYKGVAKAVDALGGIQVDVPFNMKYEDPYDVPPLVIDIPKGLQLLDGEHSLQYLRFRHNNDFTVGYPNGDLGRIEAQQKFVKNAIKKALSFKLPVVIKEVYPYVKTDLTLADMLLLVGDVVNFSADNIETTMLPGHATTIDNLSFYVHDPEQVKEMINKLYNIE